MYCVPGIYFPFTHKHFDATLLKLLGELSLIYSTFVAVQWLVKAYIAVESHKMAADQWLRYIFWTLQLKFMVSPVLLIYRPIIVAAFPALAIP